MDRKILFVDDKWQGLIEGLKDVFKDVKDIEFLCAGNLNEALKCLEDKPFLSLVLLDLEFPEGENYGLEILKEIRVRYEKLPVITFTIVEDPCHEIHSECAKLNAPYYFVKHKLNPDSFRAAVVNAMNFYEDIEYYRVKYIDEIIRRCCELGHRLVRENTLLDSIVTADRAMVENCNLIKDIAKRDSPVLITGKTGTGKGLIARAIHKESPRQKYPFIHVNCGALAEGVLESELFGHERGSFTGSTRMRKGKFEMANGGTIFLDEVDRLSPKAQGELLKVLDEGEFERLGGEETIRVNVRVLAATNKNLKKEVENEKFGVDLFYRLDRFSLELPPLRERRTDIPLLISYFMEKYDKDKRIKRLTDDVLRFLSYKYDWPGNVREVESIVENMIMSSTRNGRSIIILDDIPEKILSQETKGLLRSDAGVGRRQTLKAATTEITTAVMLENLAKAGWELENTGKKRGLVGRAALLCEISREVFQRKFKKYYGVPPEEYWRQHRDALIHQYGFSL